MRQGQRLGRQRPLPLCGEEMRTALGVSADAVKMSLYRLVKRSLVARPARGFYHHRANGIQMAGKPRGRNCGLPLQGTAHVRELENVFQIIFCPCSHTSLYL